MMMFLVIVLVAIPPFVETAYVVCHLFAPLGAVQGSGWRIHARMSKVEVLEVYG